MKLIDKDAVVAEIERLHKAHSGKYGCDEVGLNLEYLEDFLDTLEVREVSAELLKLAKLEQKPTEWSEEDEDILDGIIEDIEVLKEEESNKDVKAAYQREIDWLKSLRPQNWKPTKEQINALLWIIENTPKSVDINILLNSLYEQLKAL